MATEIKKLSGSEIEIFVELPAEDFDKYCQEAFKEIADSVEVPGFRPGKAPEKILQENIKEEDVLKKAAERAIRFSYFPLIKENKIEAIGQPDILITKMAKGNSFCYKVKTAVLPEIILPDYRKIAQDIKNRETPTLAESEVGLPGQGVPTSPTAPSESVGKNKQKIQMDILNAIADDSPIEIPEILIKAECEKMVAELRSSIENMGMNWVEYLAQLQKNEENLQKNWEKDACRRVKYGLILKEMADKEQIEISEEELEKEISEILKQNPNIDKNHLKGYIYGMLRNEKVLKFLEEI